MSDEKPQREGKTLNWSLVTTATTANQEIGSHTPDRRKAFVVQFILIEVYYTTLSATAALLGKLTVYYPDKKEEYLIKDLQASNTTSGALFGLVIPIAEGYRSKHHREKIQAVCTPAVTTSITWKVDLIGYEE